MMKRLMTVLMTMGCLLTLAHGSVETVITTITNHKGEEETRIEYREVEPDFSGAVDTFQQADVNGDGCVDSQEAKDKGILDFHKYAKENAKCLNEEEYNRAMSGSDFVEQPAK